MVMIILLLNFDLHFRVSQATLTLILRIERTLKQTRLSSWHTLSGLSPRFLVCLLSSRLGCNTRRCSSLNNACSCGRFRCTVSPHPSPNLQQPSGGGGEEVSRQRKPPLHLRLWLPLPSVLCRCHSRTQTLRTLCRASFTKDLQNPDLDFKDRATARQFAPLRWKSSSVFPLYFLFVFLTRLYIIRSRLWGFSTST